jgi:hypothetical protein
MKKVGYYHIFLTENQSTWASIALEQYKTMEDSELLDNLDELNVTCVGKSIEDFEIFSHLTKLYFQNANLTFLENTVPSDNDVMVDINRGTNLIVTENATSRKIYGDAKSSTEEYYALYFHTKGITSTLRHFHNNPKEIDLFRTYQYWRYYLNYGVLERWKDCVSALDSGYDTAGINYQTFPHTHYSGNFWWSKANHIKKLPDPATYEWFNELQRKSTDGWFRQASDRFADEQWICFGDDTKSFNVGKSISNPANIYTRRKRYAE